MINMEDEEKDIEIPGSADENVGEGEPKKKKRRKTKEERIADRRIVFWTMLIVLLVTLSFWIVPKIKNVFEGGLGKNEATKSGETNNEGQKSERKNYVEITL